MGQVRSSPIAQGKITTLHRDFAGLARGRFVAGIVKQQSCHIIDFVAKRNMASVNWCVLRNKVMPEYSRFGGSQHVDEPTVIGEPLPEKLEISFFNESTSNENQTQRGKSLPFLQRAHEGSENGWNKTGNGNLFFIEPI